MPPTLNLTNPDPGRGHSLGMVHRGPNFGYTITSHLELRIHNHYTSVDLLVEVQVLSDCASASVPRRPPEVQRVWRVRISISGMEGLQPMKGREYPLYMYHLRQLANPRLNQNRTEVDRVRKTGLSAACVGLGAFRAIIFVGQSTRPGQRQHARVLFSQAI